MTNLKSISRLGSLASLAQKTRELAAEEPENKRFRLLRIDEVISHDQVRKTFSDLEDLAASIKEFGVQVPINVRERDREGHYVIIQGERRWRAAKLAGLKKIPAIVVVSDIDEQKRMLMQLTENIQRDDMRPLEVAKAFKALTDTGLTAADIAKSLGRSHQFVSTYLHLNSLPDFLYSIAEAGSIKDATTLLLLKRAFDAKPESAEQQIRQALDENNSISRAGAQALLQKIKAPEAPAPAEKPEPSPVQRPEGTAAEEAKKERNKREAGDSDEKRKAVSASEPSGKSMPQPALSEHGEGAEAHGTPADAEAAKEAEADVVPSGLADRIRLVPVNSLRIVVDVLTNRNGQTVVEEGWIANNAVPNEEGLFCVMIDRDGRSEMQLVPVDEIDLKCVTTVRRNSLER